MAGAGDERMSCGSIKSCIGWMHWVRREYSDFIFSESQFNIIFIAIF